MRAALPFAAGGAAAEGVVSARVVALIQGVLKTMWLTKMTMATALALILAVLGGAGGLVYRSVAAGP
ncbi:MAG TPA: RNA polymerase sigma factor, partial [Planctomycetales bacterium]|nr:RNA polymerase sigma factor [Planctomycetales bacterium]